MPGDGRDHGDDGFILLESIISITLITVIMTALTSLFVTVIRVDSEQRARQVAVQVADSAASMVRSLPTSDLLTGRTQALVDAQWSGAASDVRPYLTGMEKALPAASGGTVVLPMTLSPQVVHGISYTVNVYLGWCQPVTPESAACRAPASSHDQLRAVFGVTWTDRNCAVTGGVPTCAYTSATLLSTAADPVFALNQPAAAAPTITLPSWTTYAVGDTVALAMTATGVPQFTWRPISGTWPGATLAPDGSVKGVLTTAGPTTLTVEVTDAFGRTAQATFTWTVLSPLTATNPGDQNSVVSVAVPPLTLSAAGGVSGPLNWSVDPTGSLPPGLILSPGGLVSGTPVGSAPKAYSVVLTVTDQSLTHTARLTFVWTIRLPVTLSNVGDRTGSVGQPAVSYTPVASGGTAPYTWTSTSLPPGLSMASTGLVTGSPSAVGTVAVTVTATDQWGVKGSATFTWTVNAAPTITSPGNLTSGGTSPVKIRVASTCLTTPCTYSIANQPPGVTIDSTGLMTGTVGGGATTYPAVTLRVTDGAGATATASFSWGVSAADFANTTWPVVTRRGATPEQPWNYSCPASYNSPCKIVVSGLPAGIGLSQTSGAVATNTTTTLVVAKGASGYLYLNGTVSATAPIQTYSVSVTGSLVNDPTWTRVFSGSWTVQ